MKTLRTRNGRDAYVYSSESGKFILLLDLF